MSDMQVPHCKASVTLDDVTAFHLSELATAWDRTLDDALKIVLVHAYLGHLDARRDAAEAWLASEMRRPGQNPQANDDDFPF
ncbi:MAG: hypothetical protein AAF636_18665 [Pseudomonadota bacterium]